MVLNDRLIYILLMRHTLLPPVDVVFKNINEIICIVVVFNPGAVLQSVIRYLNSLKYQRSS